MSFYCHEIRRLTIEGDTLVEEIDWKDWVCGDELVWLGVRKDGRWVASLGGKLPHRGARPMAPPGGHMVPGDYASEDAACEATKKYIQQHQA